MRRNSKKIEFGSYSERIKSPFIAKTSESQNKSGSKYNITKEKAMPGIRSDISSGFYYKHKPIKSPGTPSSTNSQSLYSGHKFGSKKTGPGINKLQSNIHNSSDFEIYESRVSKAGISALKRETSDINPISDSEGSNIFSKIPVAPVKIPSSNMINSSMVGELSSVAFGGGGLKRGSKAPYGRYEM
jgi:hypothetical protein